MNIIRHPDSFDWYATDEEHICGPFETQEDARKGWDAMYPPPEPRPPEHLYCCASCGSLAVQITSWVFANNVNLSDGGESPTNQAYCDDCDETELGRRALRVGDEAAWKIGPEKYHFGVLISVEYEIWGDKNHMVRVKTKDVYNGYFGGIDGILPKECVPEDQLVEEDR